MRTVAIVVVVTAGGIACGPLPKDATVGAGTPLWGTPTVSRSAPQPFLDEPGLTQVAVSTTTPREWGSRTETRMQVLRGGRVVCEYDGGGGGGQENHSWSREASLIRRARAPLRFDVRAIDSNNSGLVVDGPDETCTRYELPDPGDCKVVFEHRCEAMCTPTIAVSQRPGSGRIVATATVDGEPMAFVTILGLEANVSAFTDDTGNAVFDAGATRTVEVMNGRSTATAAIDPRPDLDTILTITATGCSCCVPP